MRLTLLLTLLVASACYGNTCTPYSQPAQGIDNQFPAIPASGADAVGWSIARVFWTSDASGGAPATAEQVQYYQASNPSGACYSASSSYVCTTSQTSVGVSNSTTLQVGIISNLLPSTTYHFLAQSKISGSWCSATDQTFTTLAKPSGIIQPGQPATVNTTRPSMSGTHWVYGSNCGTSGTVTAKVQDCFTKAQPGDDIGIPAGTYYITEVTIPTSPNEVSITCSGTTCTQSGSAPANGSQVIVAGGAIYGFAPSPLNPGIPYYVVNSSGSSFGLSTTSGGTAITFTDSGTNPAYVPYPITQAPIVVHSTASASLLPPVGVRLGPDTLAQYLPNMPVLVATDPIHGAYSDPFIWFAPLSLNYFLENIGFSVDGTVATSAANPTDPSGFVAPFQIPTSTHGIIFDQCGFTQPPPPTRVASMEFSGVGNAIVNSYIQWDDWWQPHVFNSTGAYPTISGNVISIPAYTWSYVNASGTKTSCSEPAGTVTIGGSGSGNLYLWENANCTMGGAVTTGVTASTTISNLTITTSASPSYPTYTYTAPSGSSWTRYAAIPFSYTFTIASGTLTDTTTTISNNWGNVGSDGGLSTGGRGQGGTGVEIAAYGPIKFDNNYFIGSAIGGIFWADDLTLGATPCPTPCAVQTTLGNLTVTRNTMTTDPVHFFYDSALWDGGDRYWRNVNENKVGRYVLYDGNIVGPWGGEVGQGQCGLHEEFANQWQLPNQPAYTNSSDWTFTNNTCFNANVGITTSYSFQGGPFGYPIKNFLIQNNLFLNDNAYANVAQNQPVTAHYPPSSYGYNCPQGQLTFLVQMEAFEFNHNTVSGFGGCQPYFAYFNSDYPSGGFTNNILNYVLDPINSVGGNTFFQDNGVLAGSCGSASGTQAIFNCINNWNWAGNVMLGTWSNSLPGSQTDLTASQLSTAQSTYFTGYTANWPGTSPYSTQNTLAGRQTQTAWFSVSANNFRLSSSSPYISGNQRSQPSPTTDGLDAGANIDQLEQHQGKVSNVRAYGLSSTAATVAFYAPDSFACGVDWTSNSWSTWTRVSGAAGSPDPRVQSVALTGLPAHGLIAARVNCAVMQPTINIQLP